MVDKSLNGTFVNNIRVKSANLQHCDTVTFGGGMDVPIGQSLNIEPHHCVR